jgi:putative nucleotidyltransferase with HDIG domain
VSEIDRDSLERLLEREDAIPPCPEVVARVSALCDDEKASARDIARAVMADGAISARLIRLANSAFYGLARRVSTVTQAAIMLGSDEIRAVVYALPVRDLFAERMSSGGIDLSSLWSHSVRVAVLARELAYLIRFDTPEEVFIAGLFHDTGQVILNELVPKEYHALQLDAWRAKADLAAWEDEHIGVSHAEVGRRLAERWNFPQILAEAIAFHHRGGCGGERSVQSGLVYAANRLDWAGVYDAPHLADSMLPAECAGSLPHGNALAEALRRSREACSCIMSDLRLTGPA